MIPDGNITSSFWKKTISPNWLRGIIFIALMVSAFIVFKQSYPRPEIMLGRLWGLRAELHQSIQAQDYKLSQKGITQWKEALSDFRLSAFLHDMNLETEQDVTSYRLESYLDDLTHVLKSKASEKIHPLAAGLFELHRSFASQFKEIPYGLERAEEIVSLKPSYVIPDEKNAPKLKMEMTKDKRGGWNIHFITENFRFAPENVSQKHKDGEGHALLYVDGQFMSRVYSHWFYLGDLPSGEHFIRVILNTNDEQEYMLNNNLIEATQRIKNENDKEKIYFGTSSPRTTDSLRKSQIRKNSD